MSTQLGQALAMPKGLSGQRFLVIVVALWGQRNPNAEAHQRKGAGQEGSVPGPEQQADAPLSIARMGEQNR